MTHLKEGDLVRWSWKPDVADKMRLDPYWCKSRVAVVLADGRLVDTFWHSLSNTKSLWSTDFEVPVTKVTLTLLNVNVSDLVPLAGPEEQYADDDVFYLCDGGGGSWRHYMRRDAVPPPERVRAVLESRLEQARLDEQTAQRKQERIKEQLVALEAGEKVRL